MNSRTCCRKRASMSWVVPDWRRRPSTPPCPCVPPSPICPPPNPRVQFGTQSGSERNNRALQELLGWQGLLMDGKYHKPAINLHKEFVTPVSDPLTCPEWDRHAGMHRLLVPLMCVAKLPTPACQAASRPVHWHLPACRMTLLRALHGMRALHAGEREPIV